MKGFGEVDVSLIDSFMVGNSGVGGTSLVISLRGPRQVLCRCDYDLCLFMLCSLRVESS